MYLENSYKKEEILCNTERGTKLGKVEIYNHDILLTTVDIVLEEQEFDIKKYISANKLKVGGISLLPISLIVIIIIIIKNKHKNE